MTKVVKCI